MLKYFYPGLLNSKIPEAQELFWTIFKADQRLRLKKNETGIGKDQDEILEPTGRK